MKLIYNNSSYFIINDNNEKEQIEKYGLTLSDIEEAIYGYSVEKMAEEEFPYQTTRTDYATEECRELWKKGFNAHKQLVKNKLFTVEDMKKAFEAGRLDKGNNWYGGEFKQFIQSLLPKEQKEWSIQIVNNKIELL